MRTIRLKQNYFNALKLHWAGKNRPSKIAEKCNISIKKYHQLVRISQLENVLIFCSNEDKTIDLALNIPLNSLKILPKVD